MHNIFWLLSQMLDVCLFVIVIKFIWNVIVQYL